MKRGFAESSPRLVLAAASVLVAFVFVEISLRILGLVPPTAFHQLDPLTGHSHRPGARGWYRHEGEAYIEINDRGLRGPPVVEHRSGKGLRLAVIGDSFAEGFQVPFERAFGPVLERALASSCAPNVEVIGFGVSDYGTAQELLTLRERVWQYAPDIVVLAFHTGNDIRNNSRELDPNPNRPYFTLEAGALVPDDAFRNWQRPRRAYKSIISRSALLLQLDYLRAKLRTAWRSDRPAGAEPGIDQRVYTKPSARDWEEAWAITELLLLAIKREVAEHGAKLLVVTLSNGIQVHPDPSTRRAFAERLGVGDLFYMDLRLANFGELHGISVLNLAPAFQRHAETHSVFLHGFENGQLGSGHWNEKGHALAGELVGRRLCDELRPNFEGIEP
jgi:hypothetical protein